MLVKMKKLSRAAVITLVLVPLVVGCSKNPDYAASLNDSSFRDEGSMLEEEDNKNNNLEDPESQSAQLVSKAENQVDEHDNSEYTIVVDAGHQKKGNSEREPIGPGAEQKKAKTTTGTSGKASGLNEYELNLKVAIKLQEELEQRGYTVLMTRVTNDVDISNAERAEIANAANADVFIRIHANGSDDPNRCGAVTMCQTQYNPYNGDIYSECKELSLNVLNSLVNATGCVREDIMETDEMSGINWSKVPVTIVEIGYMTNPEEDLLMATDEYQDKIANGIANGIENYLSYRRKKDGYISSN